MSDDVYTGTPDDKRYTSEDIDVTFSPRRCLHAAECVNHLSEVFDTDKRPWIQPAEAAADRIVEVVSLCPSGALHTHRKDGGKSETPDTTNVITVLPNSYYQIRGSLTIEAADVQIEDEMRAALCRCGASEKKPFCDNTHEKIAFEAPTPEATTDKSADETPHGTLHIKAHTNGPLEVNGPFEIRSESGDLIHAGEKTWLCRCGGSAKKPFCDGTHNSNGFTSP